jgi:hypothetical protein
MLNNIMIGIKMRDNKQINSLNNKQNLKSHQKAKTRSRKNPFLPQARKHDRIIFASFFLFIVLFGFLFLIWPKHDISKTEKRSLQQMPKLNSESLFSGQYGQQVDAFYSDQFPLRDQFMSFYNSLLNIMTSVPGSDQNIKIITNPKKPANDSFAMNAPQEKTETQDETDKDDAIGEPQKANLDLESLLENDQGADDIEQNLQFNDSANVIIDGVAMELFGYLPENAISYANRITFLRENLPEDIRLIHLMAPPAITYNQVKDLEYQREIVETAINDIYQAEKGSIIKVDALSNIGKHASEYIYFRTDHHWTGRGAYYAYEAFCESIGEKATPLEEMEIKKPNYEFLGSLYNFTGNNPLLLDSKDQAEIILPKHSGTNTIYSGTAMSDGVPSILLDWEMEIDSHYILFSGNDVALSLIKSDINNGKSIIVIKDSYANAFLPFLMDHYENVYSVDPRYLSDPILSFIKEKEINDVLVLNSAFITGNVEWIGGLDNIIGYR